MSTWIPTTEVAKLVRKYLRAEFPGQKFSVRSDSYAGGSAVRVETPKDWTQDQVHALWNTLAPWGSAGFDGMTDSSYSKTHSLCPEHGVKLTAVGAYWGHDHEDMGTCCEQAEPVHMGASYVTVQRNWR